MLSEEGRGSRGYVGFMYAYTYVLLPAQVAEEHGIATASGFDMFVGQAAYQFQLFTGRPDDTADLMRKAVLPTL